MIERSDHWRNFGGEPGFCMPVPDEFVVFYCTGCGQEWAITARANAQGKATESLLEHALCTEEEVDIVTGQIVE